MSTADRIRPLLGAALGAALVLAATYSHEVRAVAAAMVQVVNTAANPAYTKRADDPARQSFATRINPRTSGGVAVTVPAGKYLVIDDVSGFTNSSAMAYFSINGMTGGKGMERRFYLTASRNGQIHIIPGPVRMVFDPGSTVYSFATSAISPDYGGNNVDISGYYVDAN